MTSKTPITSLEALKVLSDIRDKYQHKKYPHLLLGTADSNGLVVVLLSLFSGDHVKLSANAENPEERTLEFIDQHKDEQPGDKVLALFGHGEDAESS